MYARRSLLARSTARLRRVAVLPLIAILVGAGIPAAYANTARQLDTSLVTLWTTVLETPDAQNPFGSGGGAYACIDLGHVVAPFAPNPVAACIVKPGTPILVVASSFECSTFEGNGTTDATLRTCARQADLATAPSLSIDGTPVAVHEAETPLLHITLPSDNIFGEPAATTGLSVGHGWLVLLRPLVPGNHTIVIDRGAPLPPITTTIVVLPGA